MLVRDQTHLNPIVYAPCTKYNTIIVALEFQGVYSPLRDVGGSGFVYAYSPCYEQTVTYDVKGTPPSSFRIALSIAFAGNENSRDDSICSPALGSGTCSRFAFKELSYGGGGTDKSNDFHNCQDEHPGVIQP